MIAGHEAPHHATAKPAKAAMIPRIILQAFRVSLFQPNSVCKAAERGVPPAEELKLSVAPCKLDIIVQAQYSALAGYKVKGGSSGTLVEKRISS